MSSKNFPLLSVIVPVYNVELYLEECLDSILAQTYPHLDIILINDGSTDNSGSICERYKEIDHRIRVIHKENGGLSSARNAGMRAMNGAYVTFLDSDDWLEPNAYQLLMSHFFEMSHLDVVRGEYQEVYPDAKSYKPFRDKEIVLDGDGALEALCHQGENFWAVVWSSIYKVSSLKEIQLEFQDGLLHEDEFFTMTLYGCCPNFQMLYLPTIVVNYRKNRDGAITNQGRSVKTLQHLLIGFSSVYDSFNHYAPHKLVTIHTYISYVIRSITLQLLSKDITIRLPSELSGWREDRKFYPLEVGVNTCQVKLFLLSPLLYYFVFKVIAIFRRCKSEIISRIKG